MKMRQICTSLFVIAIGIILFYAVKTNKFNFFYPEKAFKTEKSYLSDAAVEKTPPLSSKGSPMDKGVLTDSKKPNFPAISKHKRAFQSAEAEKPKSDLAVKKEGKMSLAEKIAEAFELERLRTLDPALGYVPSDRRLKALEQTKRLQVEMVQNDAFLRGNLQKSRWIERGPGNVGGRTRAIMVDLNDPTRQTLFSGGATGGLFKISNINSTNSSWKRVNDWNDVLTVSSLAQDPRNPKIMYLGTGDSDEEGVGFDHATGTYTAKGNGIYQSKDGGTTWQSLASTVLDFKTVSSMLVTADSGYVFACTFSGLFRSKNSGVTWEKVLSSNLSLDNTNNFMYKIEQASNGRLYVCNQGSIFRSDFGGGAGTWVNISKTDTGFPSGWRQTEIAVAPSNPNVLYAVGNVSSRGTPIYKTTDGGATWRASSKPFWRDDCSDVPSDADFTRGQAWYDLSLTVAPDDPNTVYVGGVDFFRSINSGQTWTQLTSWTGNCPNQGIKYAHADQHAAVFEPNNPNVLYIGTDGGVFKIDNPATNNYKVSEKTNGFITTQFYACAIHPDSGVNQFMAGAQDNGTLIVRSAGVGNVNGRSIGGDGFLCFIDENEPLIQIGSIYNGNFRLSKDGGFTFPSGATSNGAFYNPADYDSKNNILYAQTDRGDLWRWKIGTNNGEVVDLANLTLANVTHIFADPSTNNRIYMGNRLGKLYRVNNAATGTSLSDVSLVGSFTGYISSVDVEKTNSNHILVTLSSYGVVSVFESTDGGKNWINVEGNLPDMPIRWGIFNPKDTRQVMLATEGGVWSTDNLNGKETVWYPPYPGRGTPLVRTDMLKIRTSDMTVLAATYGRGMWTSSSFGTPKAAIDFNGVSYVTANTVFNGESSNAADSFLWTFGDGTTDTLENTKHTYNQIGTFNVTLMVNNDPKTTNRTTLKVLPKLNLPYKKTTSGWLGDFEKTDEHFGAYTPSGSAFSKGKSNIIGKSGTNSGNNAYVLGINEQFYQKNTTSYLYLPMYDMTQPSIYQLSFWAMFDIQKGYDGMQVEYSLDKGTTWQTLGSADNVSWYTYKNTTVNGGAFPIGTSYFSGQLDDWTRFKINISPLAGNANVAFRFVFKSDSDTANGAGIAIDDVELSKFEGNLKTAVINQSGAFAKTGTSIDVKFQTQPEFYAKTFELEMSENGRTFRKVATLTAKGVSTEDLTDYTNRIDGTPFDIYYFRVKVLNEDAPSNYKLDFYSQPFVVNRFQGTPLSINKVFPSPFTNFIGILFTGVIQKDVDFKLYDVAGRLVSSEKVNLNGVYHELDAKNLPKGIYLLSVQLGTDKPLAFKLFGGQ